MNSRHGFLRILIPVCLLATALCPFWGMSSISPLSVWTWETPEAAVFWRLRLPRVVAAFLAGAGLAVSGMVFQALFRNPLATPFTLGVSSGAALGASVYFWLWSSVSLLGGLGILGASLAGGFLSVALVYLISRSRGGMSTQIMLLAGVVINVSFSSLVMLVQYLVDAQDALRIMHWLMGSLSGLEVPRLADLACVVTVGSVLVFRAAPEIDLLAAGEGIAASRGVRIRRVKCSLFVIVSVIVGAIVSLTGPIGFVGMMTPHICRAWLGWNHRLLAPAAFFLGGAFLAVCDLGARVILAPAEVPIGIITSLIGGPFFLWTLFRMQNGEYSPGQ